MVFPYDIGLIWVKTLPKLMFISEFLWHSPESSLKEIVLDYTRYKMIEQCIFENTTTSPWGQCVNGNYWPMVHQTNWAGKSMLIFTDTITNKFELCPKLKKQTLDLGLV